jgi:thiol-disulfide isomerase/thioredoxin
MSSRIKLLLSCLALGLSFVSGRADLKVGDALPGLAAAGVVNLAGGSLPATAGQVLLVDFWASWCAPCKASFPAMAKLHADYAGRGLVIAAVSIDEKPAAAAAFWKKLSPPFATLHDRELKLVRQVVVPTMPTSYLVDRAGKVRFVHEGFHGEATDKAVRREIESLLAEKL